MILSVAGRPASQAQVDDFIDFAQSRAIDTGRAWVAELAGKLVWAVLPVINPGRTMLLFGPSDYLTETQRTAAIALGQAVVDHHAREGVRLVQVLLDPTDQAMIELYERSLGFLKMADLLYLQTSPRRSMPAPAPLEGVQILPYSPATHALYVQAILQSYQDSLDCPALSGVRDIEDVVAGHKGTGKFNPALWFLAVRDGAPLGALLLSPTSDHEAMELVYLGLAPAARGRGLGDYFMRLALATTARANCGRLTLAVDAANAPALRLYYRHGLKRLTSKVALMRDVRQNAEAATQNAG